MFKFLILIASITLLLPAKVSRENFREFIVWNVGQGLWVTAQEKNNCFHFDAGGEKRMFFEILSDVEKRCGAQLNLFSFTHWDLDHISFVGPLYKRNWRGCVLNPPGGTTKSYFKKRWLSLWPKCEVLKDTTLIHEVKFPINPLVSNESSRIFVFNRKFILPGDSISKNEKTWAPLISRTTQSILILGHHGSRTSTSQFLLETIPGITMAIASAKFSRYGHPHSQVRRRLKKFGISLLETEIWGTIHFRE